ncbi:Zinc transporter [Lachnellula hyalina]|uniref:Zinc transporter n=1 Tax=Lachnellula hyalina TaxID=1316788 RepID=A0A8H8U1S3_9HELO|nr:Zinc transporter [Lachnellula hyalina]TVY30717.1 Zinc transporter [Lachnellula hyalina]
MYRDQNVGRIIHAGHVERGDGIGLIPRRRITIVHEPLLVATTIDLHHWNGSACGYIAHSHHPRRNRSRIHCEISGAFAYEKEFTAMGKGAEVSWQSSANLTPLNVRRAEDSISEREDAPGLEIEEKAVPAAPTTPTASKQTDPPEKAVQDSSPKKDHHDEPSPPTFYIGLSLILGFILMYLVDKLPRHASENMQPPPPTRHISLDNLSMGLSSPSSPISDPESESFLQSLAPTPKQTRSLATTTGLVIHAAADGIAMGASASTDNTKLGFIIFIAIMVHKAPAAFGLTSVLLKQGLSKRAARGHLIIFSLAAPFGALSTWVMVNILGGGHIEGERGQWWTGMLLLFSAGTFLYVAMHAMQDDSTHTTYEQNGYAENGNSQRAKPKTQMRDTFAAVGGMLIPLLTQFGHHH